MSQEELNKLIKTLEEKTQQVKNDPEKARELLINSGVYTEEGQLTAPYYQSK